MVYRSSFSQHNKFEHYPRQWFFEKVLKIPYVSDMCYANAGTVLHNTLEAYHEKKVNSLAEAKVFFTEQWGKFGLDGTRLTMEKDSYWLMFLNGINLKKKITKSEFKYETEEFLGYIDALNNEDDEIYDWKSSRRTADNEKEYTSQIELYSWVYHKVFGKVPKKAIVYYLRYNGTKGSLEYIPSIENIKKKEEWYNNILKEMDMHATTKKMPDKCFTCNPYCPYVNICAKEQGKLVYELVIERNEFFINGPIDKILNTAFDKKFSYTLKNAFFMKKNNPNARTEVKFWNPTKRRLLLGFIDGAKLLLNDYAKHKNMPLTINIIDKRLFNREKITMPDKFVNGRELRDYQIEAVDKFFQNKISILELVTGSGKCFGKGTKIRMYDTSLKNVEDIKEGDVLMGDDGTPRNVLKTTIGKGQMYDIEQVNGVKYTVNDEHILCLTITATVGKGKRYIKNQKKEIMVKDYINLNKEAKHIYKGYKSEILKFSVQFINIDPYYLGLWLGDGRSNSPEICTPDKEVETYIRYYANQLNYKVSDYIYEGKCPSYAITKQDRSADKNKLLEYLRNYNLIDNKHIPIEYKKNSENIRLKLLAGYLDTDGHLAHNCFEFICVNKILFDDVVFLARSLGFYCSEKVKIVNQYQKGAVYYRGFISGNLDRIPTKIKRKQASERKQKKNPLITGLNVVKKNIDDYYGFIIDGNKKFLLEDNTVVHNTEISIEIIRKLGYKTLFVVDKIELLKQTKERIEKSLGIEVGQIGRGVMDIKPITVATIQTLNKHCETLREYLANIRLVVFDECHKVSCDSYLKLSHYLIGTEYRLGISATAYRDDKNDMKIYAATGYIVHRVNAEELIDAGWLMKPKISFISNYLRRDSQISLELASRGSDINPTLKYPVFYDNFIMNNIVRNNIVRQLADKNKDKKVLVIVKRVDHGKYLESIIPNSKYLHGETPKKERDDMFDDFSKGTLNILISTISIFAEGIDIPALEVVINACGNRGDVKTIQVLGRIIRKMDGKTNAHYIDFLDYSKFFKFASISRMRALKREGHTVNVVDMHADSKDGENVSLSKVSETVDIEEEEEE